MTGTACIICGFEEKALKEFICEGCFQNIFAGSLTKKALFCKKCHQVHDLTNEEFALITKGKYTQIAKEVLVVIETCDLCHQDGESTEATIICLTEFANA
ncbi:MAG: hypothetical protein NTX00_02950 [Candidatus Parcubacteria bacterium]|nr:hypothetical protein [Candidatus Parcubacteria bacterium]